MARVLVLNETGVDDTPDLSQWTLWFQWCRYMYDEGQEPGYGYRFIWRRPNSDGGGLQAARGQARIPSLEVIEKLIANAWKAGWGHYDGDNHPNALAILWASVDDILDPKILDDHRRTSIRAFVNGASFRGVSLYEVGQVVGDVPLGGAYARGAVFKNARELYDSLDDAGKQLLTTHFREKVEAIEREYPDIVQEFPKQFQR